VLRQKAVEQRHALHVVGHREEVERPEGLQLVAQLAERPQVARQGGGVTGDVHHGSGSAVDDLLHDAAARPLARRVEDHEVERLVVGRREHPVDGAGLDDRVRAEVGHGVEARGPVALDGDDPAPGVLEEPRKQADAGVKVQDICRQHGISDATYYKWKSKYGGMEASDIKRLREVETENSKLKRMFADLALENRALKDLIEKKL